VVKREEDKIQRAVIAQIKARGAQGLVWWAVPNGEKRDARTGAKLKRQGVRRGVSDLIFVHRCRVFALELKAPKGLPTVEQMAFISDFNAAGGCGCVAHGLDRAIKCLEAWGLLKGEMQ